MPADKIWPNGWNAIQDEPSAKNLLAEALREIGPDHQLFGLELRPIAVCGQSDDVLFQSINDKRVFEVHLTWNMKPESPPWPCFKSYRDREQWLEKDNADC